MKAVYYKSIVHVIPNKGLADPRLQIFLCYADDKDLKKSDSAAHNSKHKIAMS